jgi:hypothetical protein
MVEFGKKLYKDIGLQREVEDALPYAVVGGAYEASFERSLYGTEYRTVLNHIVPTGQQLKILFLRVFTQEAAGARFGIYQTNPTVAGATGTTEAYPVVGNVPGNAYRDYPKLAAAGTEVLRGSLVDPVHVMEGSIEFRVLSQYPGAAAQAAAGAATGAQYSVVWWGVEKVPEPYR